MGLSDFVSRQVTLPSDGRVWKGSRRAPCPLRHWAPTAVTGTSMSDTDQLPTGPDFVGTTPCPQKLAEGHRKPSWRETKRFTAQARTWTGAGGRACPEEMSVQHIPPTRLQGSQPTTSVSGRRRGQRPRADQGTVTSHLALSCIARVAGLGKRLPTLEKSLASLSRTCFESNDFLNGKLLEKKTKMAHEPIPR